ncbi:MAG: NAD-dependent epimerase/dehydratase family protein [Usitatibacter sp.]
MSAGGDRAVITGATGFVGRALAARLAGSVVAVGMGRADWREQLEATSFKGAVVFHLAARVHRDGAQDEAQFMADNAEKTRVLAEAAARQRARRFVFLSTIKVNGEETTDRPFRADDPPAPRDAYARSKLAAEQALARIAAAANLEVSIVRSPLVYGPDVRGNLRSLIRLADRAWPLPFGALGNRRSFIHVDDLAMLLMECAVHPQAPGRTYLAAHPQSISTRDLVSSMRRALGRPERLISVPAPLLEAAAALAGQGGRVRRLTRSLEIDASAAERDLGWSAAVAPAQAIEEMVRAYRAENPR